MIVTYIGGSRSGKSQFAEKDYKDSVCYIATAEILDKEMENRINTHKKRRPKNWRTYEAKLLLTPALGYETNYILDDITNLLSNIFFEISKKVDIDDKSFQEEVLTYSSAELKNFFDLIKQNNKNLSIVTNELGMSIVPDNKLARVFRDINGKINEFIAEMSDQVYLVIAGIKVRIK